MLQLMTITIHMYWQSFKVKVETALNISGYTWLDLLTFASSTFSCVSAFASMLLTVSNAVTIQKTQIVMSSYYQYSSLKVNITSLKQW